MDFCLLIVKQMFILYKIIDAKKNLLTFSCNSCNSSLIFNVNSEGTSGGLRVRKKTKPVGSNWQDLFVNLDCYSKSATPIRVRGLFLERTPEIVIVKCVNNRNPGLTNTTIQL